MAGNFVPGGKSAFVALAHPDNRPSCQLHVRQLPRRAFCHEMENEMEWADKNHHLILVGPPPDTFTVCNEAAHIPVRQGV